MRVTSTTTINVKYDTKASELRAALANIPDTARVSVESYRGDQRDPSYTHLKFTWTEER